MKLFKLMFPLLLLAGATVQLVLAVMAETDENYVKALYEMAWAAVFLFWLYTWEEKK